MKNLRLAPLGCALLFALAAPAHAWSVQDKSGNTQIKLTDDGKLGVGMTPPSGSSAKLEVAGQVKITGGSPGAGKVLTSDTAGLASWQTPSSGNTCTRGPALCAQCGAGDWVTPVDTCTPPPWGQYWRCTGGGTGRFLGYLCQ